MILKSVLAVVLAAAGLTFAGERLVASALANPGTCIASSPTGGSLRIYNGPDVNSGVIGGIGVGQCNINVTNQCEPGWCVIVFESLGGWAQMEHISGSLVQPPPSTQPSTATGAFRRFEITGGSGSMSMIGGFNQPIPIDPGGVFQFRADDDASGELVLVPEITTEQISMSREQGNVWVGSFSQWSAIAGSMKVTFTGPETATPVLRIDGRVPMGTFEMSFNLRPLDAAPSQQNQTADNTTPPQSNPVTPPANNQPSLQPATNQDQITDYCTAVESIRRRVSLDGSFEAGQRIGQIMESLGAVAGSNAPEQENCRRALEAILNDPDLRPHLEQAGVIAPNGTLDLVAIGQEENSPACRELDALLEQLARFSGPDEVQATKAILQINEVGGLYAVRSAAKCQAAIDDIMQASELQTALANAGLGNQANVTPAPVNPTPSNTPGSIIRNREVPCSILESRVRAIRIVNDPWLNGLLNQLQDEAGIDDLYAADEGDCDRLTRLLDREGLDSVDAINDYARRIAPNPQPGPGPVAASGCQQAIRIRQEVVAINNPQLTEIFESSVSSVPISDLTTASQAECRMLMELLANEGLGTPVDVRITAAELARTNQSPNVPPRGVVVDNSTQSACVVLSRAVRPILRGGAAAARSRILQIFQQNGIANLNQASNAVCLTVIEIVNGAGIIVNGTIIRIDVSIIDNSEPSDTRRVALQPDLSDFVPEPASNDPQPVPGELPDTQGAENRDTVCLELGDLLVEVVTRGETRPLIQLADILAQYDIKSLTEPTTAQQCQDAITAAEQAGLDQSAQR